MRREGRAVVCARGSGNAQHFTCYYGVLERNSALTGTVNAQQKPTTTATTTTTTTIPTALTLCTYTLRTAVCLCRKWWKKLYVHTKDNGAMQLLGRKLLGKSFRSPQFKCCKKCCQIYMYVYICAALKLHKKVATTTEPQHK